MNFIKKLEALPRQALYMVLVISIAATLRLFPSTQLPVIPDANSMDLYISLMNAPQDKPVFIQSDWTNSTRGESRGHFMALMRIIMNRKLKFVFYSAADAQAPQVARDAIKAVNDERAANGQYVYKNWQDFVGLGFFPNAENSLQAIATNMRTVFSARRAADDKGVQRVVLESPVLQNVAKIEDCGMYIVISASNSLDIAVERLSAKTTMNAMVTGVMGPQAVPFKSAGQLKGLGIGLKAVYDLEYMMANGVNYVPPGGKDPLVKYPRRFSEIAEPIKDVDDPSKTVKTFGQGASYYLALHVALFLMILAIAVGNLGTFLARKKGIAPTPLIDIDAEPEPAPEVKSEPVVEPEPEPETPADSDEDNKEGDKS